MITNGCQYCQMDTGGNHESNCPLARRDTTAFLMADIPPYSLTFSCTGCDAKDKEIASLTASLKAAEEEVTRLKSVLSSDEEQMKVLVNRNAALRDAAVIKHQEDEIVVQKMRSERDALKAEVAELKGRLHTERQLRKEEYWFWQGDGEDHLESLTCPVVIRPEVLAELLK